MGCDMPTDQLNYPVAVVVGWTCARSSVVCLCVFGYLRFHWAAALQTCLAGTPEAPDGLIMSPSLLKLETGQPLEKRNTFAKWSELSLDAYLLTWFILFIGVGDRQSPLWLAWQ